MAKEETSTYLVDTPRPSGFQNHCVFSFVAGHHLKKYQGEHHTSVACKKNARHGGHQKAKLKNVVIY